MRITAKEFFLGYRRIEHRIESKIEERARIRALGERVTASYSSEPRGGSGPTSKVEIAAVRLADLDGVMADEIALLAEYRRFAQKIVNRIPDYRLRDLIDWRYFTCWEWDKIGVAMNVEVKQLYKMHIKALDEVQAILDGMELPQFVLDVVLPAAIGEAMDS